MPRCHSVIQFAANSPREVSAKTFSISERLTTRGPVIRTANSHVRLLRREMYSSMPSSSITSTTERRDLIALA